MESYYCYSTYIIMQSNKPPRKQSQKRGTVVVAERLCVNGNEQACNLLQSMCEDGYDTACRDSS